MKRVFCYISIFLAFLCLSATSYAALSLELTKGVASAIPIAVVPFQVEGAKKPVTDVSQVITKDLANSGEFKVLDAGQIKSFPSSAAAISYPEWRDAKVNYLVVGKVESAGWGKLKVTFSLADVYKGLSAPNESVLLDKVFEVKEDHLRPLAHRIADMIYEQITGIRGVFSTKLAYVLVRNPSIDSVQYDLMVSDADGDNPHSILTSDEPILSTSWSSDGKKIAYVSLEGRRASIYVSDVETGHRRLISQQPGINGAPTWSPDDSRLALVLSNGQGTNVCIADSNGGNLKSVTTGTLSIDTEPSWSPDGKSLVFTSDRGGSPQIYRADLATGEFKRLTFNGDYNTSATYTTNGNQMVLLHRENGQYSIAVQDLSTGVLTTLTHAGHDQSPSVSPNGKMVVYISQLGQKSTLNFVSIDGRIHLTLPEASGDIRSPAWGPFAQT